MVASTNLKPAAFDFRSDTVTRPTPDMLSAMMNAAVGDDVFGDDPTVNALEAEAADLLGKEAAVFVTSGTLSNQLAMCVHLGPLSEVLCDHRAHIHMWEAGAIHATGAAVAPIAPDPGEAFLTAEAISANVRTDHSLYHQPVTKLLALENTLNGDVMPLAQLQAATTQARALGLATHLDGARLWHAVEATGHSAREYAAPFDTVSVCPSKRLGAPVGSHACVHMHMLVHHAPCPCPMHMPMPMPMHHAHAHAHAPCPCPCPMPHPHAPSPCPMPHAQVSVCLSKGLGAPIGSVLVGAASEIDLARHYRKRYGGGWRQAGLLAAAGLHALRHHRERLSE